MCYTKNMIANLRGKIIKQDEKYVVLDVNGVGYKVFCNTLSPKFLGQLPPPLTPPQAGGEETSFFIHTVVREDALELFGFFDETSLKLFEKLINISGIGPRSALAIVNVGTIESLTEAINKGDLGYLTAVSGIGKKTAEKIVLELKDKLGSAAEGGGTLLKDESDAIDALKSLGYREREARDALKKVPKEIVGTSQKVKEALKILGQ